MEYVIGAVILAVVVYMLTRKKKEKPPIEQTIEKEEQKEEQKEVIVKTVPTEQKVYLIKDGKKEWGRMKYMPQGLQVFDENGKTMLDITDTLTSITGEITCNKTNGKLYVEGLNGRDIWLVEKDSEIFDSNYFNDEMNLSYPVFPIIRVDGDYIIWEYPEAYIDRTNGAVDDWQWLKPTYYRPSMFGGAFPVSVTYLFGVI